MLGIRGVVFDMDEVVFSHLAFGAHVRGDQSANKSAGLDELLEYLHDYMVPMAAVSSGSKSFMEAALEKAGVLSLFDVLMPNSDLGDTKQSASVLEQAGELLGVPFTRTLVVCSNAEVAKIARKRGYVSVLVSPEGEDAKAGRVTVVRELDEIIDLLEVGAV